MSILSFTVSESESGTRLDRFLSDQLPDLSRGAVQAVIRDGRVQCTGKPVMTVSLKVNADQIYEVQLTGAESTASAQPQRPQPQDIPLDIVFEDEHLMIVHKPAGLVVHPGSGVRDGTLVNALLHHCGDRLSQGSGPERPGIVHRLDRETSGLMMVAKTDAAHEALSEALQMREIKRSYQALVWGRPVQTQGMVDAPIGRHPKNRLKMAVTDAGKPAVTHFEVEEMFVDLAVLLDVRLETGRTHQIRVHLNHIGYPVVGDPVYGRKASSWIQKQLSGLKGVEDMASEVAVITGFGRQALHAYALTLQHPVTGEPLAFEAPVPDDFAELLAAFRSLTS